MADLRQFDVQGARDAGYSGAEIQFHLMKELGYPPSEAQRALADVTRPIASPTPTMETPVPREKMSPREAPRQTIAMPDEPPNPLVSRGQPGMPESRPGSWLDLLGAKAGQVLRSDIRREPERPPEEVALRGSWRNSFPPAAPLPAGATLTDPGILDRAEMERQLAHPQGMVDATTGPLVQAVSLTPTGQVATSALRALANPSDIPDIAREWYEADAPIVGRKLRAPEPMRLDRGASLTGEEVLREAAAPKKRLSFADFRKQNPDAGVEMFDLENAAPAIPSNKDLPRYDPPRGIPARLVDALGSQKVKNQLIKWVEAGKEKMKYNWYRTSPLYQEFEKEYGPEEAEKYFRTLIDHISASSPGMKIPDNIRTGSYYNYVDRQGMPVPTTPAPGYGAKTQQLHMQNERNIRAGGLDPFQNPKPASFIENLAGNERPVTIDTHNFRALGMAAKDPRFLATSAEEEIRLKDGTKVKTKIKPRQMYERGELTMKEALKHPTYWESDPAETEYGAYERYQQKLAGKMGIEPATWQGQMWVGAGEQTGLGSPPEPFLRTLAARIHYTAARLNADPQVILKKFIRGEIPLLELGAAAAGLGAAGAVAGGDDAQQRGRL